MSEQQDNPNRQYANPNQNYPYYYYPQTSPAYYPVYRANQFPQQNQSPPQQQTPQMQAPSSQGTLPLQQSYIENILRLNRGKLATVYMTFEGANAQTFKGIVEAAGRDHIILSDPQSNKRYLLLMVYLDYITFDEEINYAYPFGGGQQMATYSPRS